MSILILLDVLVFYEWVNNKKEEFQEKYMIDLHNQLMILNLT
jgi:hypothetical protein